MSYIFLKPNTAIVLLLFFIKANCQPLNDFPVDSAISFEHLTNLRIYEKMIYRDMPMVITDSYDFDKKGRITSTVHYTYEFNPKEPDCKAKTYFFYNEKNNTCSRLTYSNFCNNSYPPRRSVVDVYYDKENRVIKCNTFVYDTIISFKFDSLAKDSLEKGLIVLSYIDSPIASFEGDSASISTINYIYKDSNSLIPPSSGRVMPQGEYYRKYLRDSILNIGWHLTYSSTNHYDEHENIVFKISKEYIKTKLLNYDSTAYDYSVKGSLLSSKEYLNSENKCSQFTLYENTDSSKIEIYETIGQYFYFEYCLNKNGKIYRLKFGQKEKNHYKMLADLEKIKTAVQDIEIETKVIVNYNKIGQVSNCSNYYNGKIDEEIKFEYGEGVILDANTENEILKKYFIIY